MSKKAKQEWISFYEDGKRFMLCKHCQSEYVTVNEDTVAVTCSMCTHKLCIAHMSLEEMMPSLRKKVTTGRPPGWHFMNEFVDKDGNVFHKGKEMPKLKGTLPPTKVKSPKKKTKRRTKEEILIAREAEKKAELKKAIKKQKDFLNHKFGD